MDKIERNRELRKKHYKVYAKFRNKAKLTDSDICDKTGIARQTMWCWSKGDYEPKIDKKVLIAKALDVPLEKLVGV